MNGEPEPGPEDARIRGLLAEQGSGRDATGTPLEVVARLEETLAALVRARREEALAEQSLPEQTGATVVPLRRRRSRALTAAAAVIVLGVGGTTVATLAGVGPYASRLDSGGSAGSTADDSAEKSVTGGAESQRDSAVSAGLPQVRATAFGRDVTALLGSGSLRTPERPRPSPDQQAPQGALTDQQSCVGPEVSDGARSTVIAYDGSVAALVVHPVARGRRLVEAWTCPGTTKLATARVRAVDLRP